MHTILRALAAALVAALPGASAAAIIDFEGLASKPGLTTIDGPVQSDGATVSPVYGHFDVMVGDPALVSSGQAAVGIHNGASGSGLRIDFPAPETVQSFDVPGWIIARRGTPDATVTSSAGGTRVVAHAATGTVELAAAAAGFADVDWIEITMPGPDEVCVTLSGGIPFTCSTMFIDRVVLGALAPVAVPAPPAAAGLLGACLLLACLRRRGARRTR